MGEVDRIDQNVVSLRISHKGKKWWYPLFLFKVDAVYQSVWQLYKIVSKELITYCNFWGAVITSVPRKPVVNQMGDLTMRGLNVPKQNTNIAIITHDSCVEIIVLGFISTVWPPYSSFPSLVFSFQLTYEASLWPTLNKHKLCPMSPTGNCKTGAYYQQIFSKLGLNRGNNVKILNFFGRSWPWSAFENSLLSRC